MAFVKMKAKLGSNRMKCAVGRPAHNRGDFGTTASGALALQWGPKAAPIRFCETNPPFFDGFFDGSGYEYMGYTRNARGKSVGSFSETNPPGGVFRGVGSDIWQKMNPK